MVYSKGISESNVEIIVGGYSGVSDKVTEGSRVVMASGSLVMGAAVAEVAVAVAALNYKSHGSHW